MSKPILSILRFITLALIIYFLVLGLSDYINLTTADLGRHITNGKYIVDAFVNAKDFYTQTPLYTNFYSYTSPGFAVHNHHWLTGVIHYFTHEAYGFVGLSVLNIVVIVIGIMLAFVAGTLLGGYEFAAIALAISMPLLVWRDEVRPESFSYLLMAAEFLILTLFRFNKLSFRTTAILLAQFQLLWINLHVFFCVGILVIGLFYLEEAIKTKSLFKWKAAHYAWILVIVLLASLINPFGLGGLLEPLNIFKNYAYELAENQSVFFMHKRFPHHIIYYYFDGIFLLNLIAWIWLYFKSKSKLLEFIKNNFAYLGIFFVLALLAYKTNRAIPVWVIYSIPIFAYNLSRLFTIRRSMVLYMQVLALVIAGGTILYTGVKHDRLKRQGLAPYINRSANFFKALDIQGPIFNNYDIGGYLIYHLFPQRRVFVDNRPEAYENRFFDEIYKVVQADEEKWQKLDAKLDLNVIFYMRHDMTQHGQPFLIRRIEDPDWVPVFVDQWVILLVKNHPRNQAIIDKFRLPQSLFKTVRTAS